MPKYAVLVTGAWGVGKTFQVLESIPAEDRHYVSLYGFSSTDEIHAAILAEIYPLLAKSQTLGKLAAKLGEKIGGFGQLLQASPYVVQAIMKKEVDITRTIIFDDIERCRIPLADKLGVINFYVEQRGCGVVVIANDESLRGDAFDIQKEKIFGQVVQVEPQVASAFPKFLSEIKIDDARTFIESYSGLITHIFALSKACSLRILRHVIQDLARLHSCMTKEHSKNEEAMRELLSVFAALDIEVRLGVFLEENLRRHSPGRLMGHMRRMRGEETPDLDKEEEIYGKYQNIPFDSALIDDDTLVSMLIYGHYDVAKIQDCLNRSRYFAIAGQMPPWRILSQFAMFPDDLVDSAFVDLQRQFEHRELSRVGEMLHLCALQLMFRELGIIESPVCEGAALCKSYIDDLLNEGRLTPKSLEVGSDDVYRTYGGSSYRVSDSTRAAFEDIVLHVKRARDEALNRKLPDVAHELMRKLGDPERFYREISPTSPSFNELAELPVLSCIEPNAFVERWLGAPDETKHWVARALNERYSVSSVDLSSEVQWAQEVRDLLFAKACETTGFQAARLRKLGEWAFARIQA